MCVEIIQHLGFAKGPGHVEKTQHQQREDADNRAEEDRKDFHSNENKMSDPASAGFAPSPG